MISSKKIVVIIPAYNEELLLPKVLAEIPDYVDHVVVIDDGSSDRTAEIARSFNAVVLAHETNRGVGESLQTGVDYALKSGGDIVVNLDADHQFNPSDIKTIAGPIVAGEADFVTASRFIDKSLYPHMPRIKFHCNRLLSRIVSRIAGRKFYDVSCGFRAYSRDVLLKLNLFGKYTYTHESILILAFLNTRMREVPILIRGVREAGKSKIASNLFKYGIKIFHIILQTYRDYDPFRLFHRIGLFFLVVAAGSGVFLFVHYLLTAQFSPYKFLGFVFMGGMIFYVLFLLIGFVAESLSLVRKNQEKILYLLKKINFQKKSDADD